MHQLLARAIETICLNRDDGEWESLDEEVLAAVVAEFGENGLVDADRLFGEIPRQVPYEVVCDLFDLLAWRTDDNGASMTRTTDEWLREGKDVRKLRIALGLEVFPFLDKAEMHEVLSRLAETHSVIAYRCHELIGNRARMSGNSQSD